MDIFERQSWDLLPINIQESLLDHAYSQLALGLFSALCCASIVFIGLSGSPMISDQLYAWFSFFILVTIYRSITYFMNRYSKHGNIFLWRSAYIIGSILGGFSWGLIGFLFLPDVHPSYQILMILMLAGVTAGAVPLSAAIPEATLAFLLFSIYPFIFTIASFKTHTYYLFNFALSLYLLYTMLLSLKTYQLIRNAIELKFKNEFLLHNLEFFSTHDPLTKLPNRRYFDQKLKLLLIQRMKNDRSFALLFIDLDRFKRANDKFGHDAGDYILVAISERLVNYFKNENAIARLGGDELAIILEYVTSMQSVEQTARDVCEIIAMPILYGDIELEVTASIGISVFPEDGTTADELLNHADKRMYKVKAKGGNRYLIPEVETT